MNPRSFPKTITIQLPEALRRGLEAIASREPYDDDGDLLLVVLSRGIVATLAPDEDEATKVQSRQPSLAVRGTHRPFPKPSVLYRRKQRKQMEQAQADADSAIAEQEGTEPQRPGSSPRVEGHLPVRVPDEVRKSLEDWLHMHPEVNEEEAITMLLQRGLDHEGHVGQNPQERKAAAMVRLAERLYARSKRRCG